jgi:hypothetical protein
VELDNDLFFALSGTRLPVDDFDLGRGLSFHRTYGHFMAPFLMAFNRAEPGAPHPRPWAAARGGLGLDIEVILQVRAEFAPEQWFDRLNTGWFITALLRLKSGVPMLCPAVLDRDFESIRQGPPVPNIIPLEIGRRPTSHAVVDLTPDTLDWLYHNWWEAGLLMRRQPALLQAFTACDDASIASSASLALLTIWGAIEHLFAPARQELRFRVSAGLAAYLEPIGRSRAALQRQAMKLYDNRSRLVHAAGERPDGLDESLELLRRAILRALDEGHAPTRSELDARLFEGT